MLAAGPAVTLAPACQPKGVISRDNLALMRYSVTPALIMSEGTKNTVVLVAVFITQLQSGKTRRGRTNEGQFAKCAHRLKTGMTITPR